MEYLSVQNFSDKWNISKRRIQILCREGRIKGAVMAGNKWVIPKDARRPPDARVNSPVPVKETASSNVRKELKRLLKNLYERVVKRGILESEQKTCMLSSVAYGLCVYYLQETEWNEEIYQTVYRNISGTDDVLEMDEESTALVLSFLNFYRDDAELDDILSWAYQYSNRIIVDNRYSKTQFFTEKYMITYLIQNMPDLTNAEKIVDPCIGGGNFLAECLEYMCNKFSGKDLQQYLIWNAGKLYGYDIDHAITNIALVNIRLRALSFLKRKGEPVTFDIWDQICPNIYRSEQNPSVCGSLAVDHQIAVNIVSGEKTGLEDILGNADVVLTNPPFATIKGMPQDQKDFLKTYYPDANCDTCVSFLDAVYQMLKPQGVCGIVSQNA